MDLDQSTSHSLKKPFLSSLWVTLLCATPLLAALGCAPLNLNLTALRNWAGGSTAREGLPAIIEPRVFLGGEALAQKKDRMRRVHADMVHLYRGYEANTRLHKREDQRQLAGFIRPFIDRHVEPLFTTNKQGWNTDLRLLEANLLFAKAALYVAIEEEVGLDGVISTLSERFQDHDALLIEYPIGDSQTMAEGIRSLRKEKASL